MSHLVRLRGKDTVQCAHCALLHLYQCYRLPVLPYIAISGHEPSIKMWVFRAIKQGFISQVFEASHFWAFLSIFEQIAGARTSGFYCPFMHLIAVIHLHLQLIAVILLHLRPWMKPIS